MSEPRIAEKDSGFSPGDEADEALPLWPTPTKCGNYNAPREGASSGTGLATAVTMWPTPRKQSSTGPNLKGREGKQGLDLQTAVAKRNWPTPAKTAYKGWSEGCKRGRPQDRIDFAVESETKRSGIPGSLNPDWVEWLMGWPVGWTDPDTDLPYVFEWSVDPADIGRISRVTTKSENRAKRIQALGDGQVPHTAALAFLLLLSCYEQES